MSNVPKVVTMPAGGEVRIIPSERELRNLELRGDWEAVTSIACATATTAF